MTIYANDINYFKSGTSSPDSWIDKAKKEIVAVGGEIVGSQITVDDRTGKAGFKIAFTLDGDNFVMDWATLEPKDKKDLLAARRQAATALYHDVKNACVALKFKGARNAFLAYLVLEDGRTMGQVATPELLTAMPQSLLLIEE